jgi:hypothetical protein
LLRRSITTLFVKVKKQRQSDHSVGITAGAALTPGLWYTAAKDFLVQKVAFALFEERMTTLFL